MFAAFLAPCFQFRSDFLLLLNPSYLTLCQLSCTKRSCQAAPSPKIKISTFMVSKSDVVLIVAGAVEHDLKLSFSDLARFPRQNLRATDELGKESLFEGVLVAEILKAAGGQLGKEVRGKRRAVYLRVEGADGYRVICG